MQCKSQRHLIYPLPLLNPNIPIVLLDSSKTLHKFVSAFKIFIYERFLVNCKGKGLIVKKKRGYRKPEEKMTHQIVIYRGLNGFYFISGP